MLEKVRQSTLFRAYQQRQWNYHYVRKTDIDAVCKENIGVVFDGNNYPDMLTPKQLGKVFENIYSSWNKEKYEQLLKKFNLPLNKKIKKFSKGMKMKYAISVAFSHNSKLLILDEATSGLDPIMRDEILDMFLDFIQDEENSIWYLHTLQVI